MVARDDLTPLEVATQRKADEYCHLLALPATFKAEASRVLAAPAGLCAADNLYGA